ncbi:MAG TPA: hypothetical protein VNE16_14390 [Vicinamibacterales bacterium]|nr:hypothetical protein [Vicinamibacterales bacterium]
MTVASPTPFCHWVLIAWMICPGSAASAGGAAPGAGAVPAAPAAGAEEGTVNGIPIGAAAGVGGAVPPPPAPPAPAPVCPELCPPVPAPPACVFTTATSTVVAAAPAPDVVAEPDDDWLCPLAAMAAVLAATAAFEPGAGGAVLLPGAADAVALAVGAAAGSD